MDRPSKFSNRTEFSPAARKMTSASDHSVKGAAANGVRYRPDALDRKLIAHLRADGRASLSALCETLGVARGTVRNRLDRLVETGILQGFTVQLRDDDGEAVRAIMMIGLAARPTKAVFNRLRGIPEIRLLHTTNGRWDLVATIRADSLQDFDRVISEVQLMEGVAATETNLLLSRV